MQKLIIQDIVKINDYWYAVYFTGPQRPLDVMHAYLRQQKKDNAYWDENALHGKGAWIVRLDFFKRLTTRFANLERAIVVAERVAALKEINMLARRK